MARRVGAQRAGAGLLPEVELSRRRRARVSIGLGPTNGHLDGTSGIAAEQIVGHERRERTDCGMRILDCGLNRAAASTQPVSRQKGSHAARWSTTVFQII